MRRFSKKPAILGKKIKLAMLLRKQDGFTKKENYGSGFYWSGEVEIVGKKISIYYQRYVNREGVDYVTLKWLPEYKALTVSEINSLLQKLEKQ